MYFNTTALAGDQFLVEGSDARGHHDSTVVDGRQWMRLTRNNQRRDALAKFDSEVEEFFAPLVEAAEAAQTAGRLELDPLLYVVEQEGSAGTPGSREIVTELEPGSVILRAIEEGHLDRLLWVKGELLLTAAPLQDRRKAGHYDIPEDVDGPVDPLRDGQAIAPQGDAAEGSDPF